MTILNHPTARLWQQALSTDSVFCDALVAMNILTPPQMERAAERYCLGASRSRGVIFWQIDQEGRVHDGKIMYYQPDCHRSKAAGHRPTWVSFLLQRRYGWSDRPRTSHCLFGLHLLGKATDADLQQPKPIAVVEAEKTAVILSEVCPQFLWLASGGLGEVQAEKFRALRGYDITLFPDTGPEGLAFKRWLSAAEEVNRQPWWQDCPPLGISRFLEDQASAEQKSRKIDLADYYLENIKPQRQTP